MRPVRTVFLFILLSLVFNLNAQRLMFVVYDSDRAPVANTEVDIVYDVECNGILVATDMFTATTDENGVIFRDASALLADADIKPGDECNFSYTAMFDGETINSQEIPISPALLARTADLAARSNRTDALQPQLDDFQGEAGIPVITVDQMDTWTKYAYFNLETGDRRAVIPVVENTDGDYQVESVDIDPSYYENLNGLQVSGRYNLEYDHELGDFNFKLNWTPDPPLDIGSYSLHVGDENGEPVYEWKNNKIPFATGFYGLDILNDGTDIQFDWTRIDIPNLPDGPQAEGKYILDVTLDGSDLNFDWSQSGILEADDPPETDGTYGLQTTWDGPDIAHHWVALEESNLPEAPQTEGDYFLQGTFDGSILDFNWRVSPIFGYPALPEEDGNFHLQHNSSSSTYSWSGPQPNWGKGGPDQWTFAGDPASTTINFPGSININNDAQSNINYFDGSNIYGFMTTQYICALNYYVVSDARAKEDIRPLTSSLAKVLKLNPKTYRFRNDSGKAYLGFLAQEAESVVPEVVQTIDLGGRDPLPSGLSGKVKTVSYNSIVPLLTGAIQEQQALIELQNEKIGSQDERIRALEAQVQLLMEKVEEE